MKKFELPSIWLYGSNVQYLQFFEICNLGVALIATFKKLLSLEYI